MGVSKEGHHFKSRTLSIPPSPAVQIENMRNNHKLSSLQMLVRTTGVDACMHAVY